jgi:hypothetical protein
MVDICAAVKYKTLSLFCFGGHNYRGWRLAAAFMIKCNIFNMQDSFILRTSNVIYIKVSWAGGYTLKCDGWACFSAHSLRNRSVIDEMAYGGSFLLSTATDILFS